MRRLRASTKLAVQGENLVRRREVVELGMGRFEVLRCVHHPYRNPYQLNGMLLLDLLCTLIFIHCHVCCPLSFEEELHNMVPNLGAMR